MKKLFTLFGIAMCVLFLGNSNLYSQTTIFSQNFDAAWTIASTLSPAWSSVGGANQEWHMNTYTTGWSGTNGAYSPTGAAGTTQSARFHSYDAPSGMVGELITPLLDFSTYPNTKKLQFYHINTTGTDLLNVYLSTDGGTTYGTTLLTIGVSATWTLYTVDLGSTTSSNVKIKFTGTSDWGTTDIGLDQVAIYNTIPMSGVFTIDNTLPLGGGNYPSFTAAINALNLNGISGPVTFNVTSGQTFTEDPLTITATGTVANPIVFQNSISVGTHPVIKPTGGTTYNSGIAIYGGDYFTFDGIDITINSGSLLNYGYYIFNASATNGAQNNTIKNSKITLNRTNTTSKGIYQYTATTPTNQATGNNNNNKYYNITVENSYTGIYLQGTSATYFDSGNEVGVISGGTTTIGASTANDIGFGSSAVYGIRTSYQSGVKIYNSVVRNLTCTSNSTRTAGIFLENTYGTSSVYNNKVYNISNSSTTVSNTTNYVVVGMRLDVASGNTVNVYNNFIYAITQNPSAATTATPSSYTQIGGIVMGVTAGTSNLYYNSIRLETSVNIHSSCIISTGGTANTMVFKNNIFSNFTGTQSGTPKHYGIMRQGASGTISSSSNNDIFIQNSGNGYVGYFTADQATLANWNTATGQDANSKNIDPSFTGTTDLHASASGIDGQGTPITVAAGFPINVTTDIDNEARNVTTPDIGADEFVAGVDNPTGFAATTSSSTQINLTFTPNASSNNVLIVWNSTGTFTTPSGAPPSAGNPFAGGTVVSLGTTSPVNHTGLTLGTLYYYKAWSYNGSAYSPGVISNATTFNTPTVTSTAASSISYVTATTGGNVTSDGGSAITERGVCYSLSLNPTTSDSKVTSAGTTGSYSCNLTGLSIGTTYHFRAYAINSVGTSYGSDLTFTTLTPATIPYTQDFNASTSIPAGWTSDMYISSSHGVSGTNGLYKELYYNTAYATSLTMGVVPSQTRLKFDYRIVNWSGYPSTATVLGASDKIDILVSTDFGATFIATPLYTINSTTHITSTAFATKTFDISAYAGANINIKFSAVWASGDYYVDIDNFIVEPIPSTPVFSINPSTKDFGDCPQGNSSPNQTFNISNTGGGALIINAGGIVLAGTNPGEFTLTDGNTYPISLTGSATATVQVKFSPTTTGSKSATLQITDNAAGSPHSAALTGNGTPVFTPPYSQDFEGVTTAWSTGINTGTANDWVIGTPAKIYITAPHGGTKCYVTLTTGNTANSEDAFVKSPVFNLSTIPHPMLSFWHNFYTETGWDACIVEYSTDVGATWAKIDANLGTGGTYNTTLSSYWYNSSSASGPITPPKFSGNSNTYTGNATGWINSISDLTALSGQAAVQFRFRYGSDASGPYEGWAIDDFSIYNLSVANPSSFTATASSSSQIDLGWALNANGNDVLLVYNSTNSFDAPVNGTPYSVGYIFPCGATVLQNNTNILYNHSGLTASTTYYYKAFSRDSKINYSTGVSASATTPAPPITSFPWTEPFTSWPPSGFTLTGGTQSWAQYSASNSSAFCDFWGWSIPNNAVMLTPNLNFSALTSPRLTFKWSHMYSSTYPLDELKISITTDNGANWTALWDYAGTTLNSNDGATETTPGTFVSSGNINLTSYKASIVKIKIDGISGYGPDVFVDDVTVDEAPINPIFSITPTLKDFGNVSSGGASGDQTFTITNTGGGELSIDMGSISLTGANIDQFILYDNNTYPIRLTNSQTASVRVQFTPTSAGSKTANLTIADNIAKSTHDISLAGTGIVNPPQSLTGSLDVNYKPVLNWQVPNPAGEIKLDDGTVEDNVYFTPPSVTTEMVYNKLVSPSNNTISQISLYAYGASATTFTSVMLCPDDGTGKPNLVTPWATFPSVAVGTSSTWIFLTLPTPQSVTAGQVFYIVAQWPAISTNLYIALDNTSSFNRSYYTVDGGTSWTGWTGNFLMRAYLGTGTDKFNAGATPYENKFLPMTCFNEKKFSKNIKSNVESISKDGSKKETLKGTKSNKNDNLTVSKKDIQISVPAAMVYGSSSEKTLNSYIVKRGTTSGSYDQTYAGITGTTYTDNSALGSTTYYYVVSADYSGGISPNSNEISVGTYNWNYGNNALSGNDLYYFSNSTAGANGAPSKPEYFWIDPITNGHTEVTTWVNGTGDDSYFNIPDIGFNFMFFGNTYKTNAYIGSNGYISFGTGYTLASAYQLPSTNAPFNSIIGALYDLDCRTGTYSDAHVYYGTYGDKFVVTWMHAHQYGSAVIWITFQIALVNDGFIGNNSFLINYNDDQTSTYATNNIVNNCSVGLNNIDGTKGLNYRYLASRGPLFYTGGKGTGAMSLGEGPSSGSLPVNLKSFVSSVTERDVKLTWITEKEQSNKGFEVLRSKFGENNFTSFGFVSSKGNHNSQSNYEFIDKKLNTGKYNYKLKQIDLNGNIIYYTLNNFVEISAPKKYNLSQNYPNPFNPTTKIDFDLPFDSRVRLVVYDILGREVKSLLSGELKQAGFYTVELNSSNLASGTYFYRMIANGQNKDYIFTKKMVVVK